MSKVSLSVSHQSGNLLTTPRIIIVWDRCRICGPSLAETSLCGAYLYMEVTCPVAGIEDTTSNFRLIIARGEVEMENHNAEF